MGQDHSLSTHMKSDEDIVRSRVRKLVETWSSVWDEKTTERAAEFYSKDKGLVFFDVGPIHLGWDQYSGSIERSFQSIMSLKLRLNDDMGVVLDENFALTTATGLMTTVTKDGKTDELNVRFTGVWRRERGSWVLVHDHWSQYRPAR